MTNNLKNQILSLHQRGLSRREISSVLGITEWKVRTAVRAKITQDVVLSEKEYKNSGNLRLKNVTRKKVKKERYVILNDIHIPYHDQKSLALVLAYLDDNKPDTIVLNGDIIDCYSASSYRKDPARLHTLQDEFNETIEFLSHIKKRYPRARIVYTMGNHEERIEKQILDKLGDFSTVEELAIEERLKLRELDIQVIDKNGTFPIGPIEVTHGTMVRKDSGASVKAHHAKLGGSVLIGHVHRLGTFYRTNKWGTHICIENGYLGRNDFEYVNRPDWQQGFTEIIKAVGTDDISFRQHPIIDHKLVVDGVIYE